MSFKTEKGMGRDPQSAKIKATYLRYLKAHGGDRTAAAKAVGMDEVQIRSWRHMDAEFQKAYKDIIAGVDGSPDQEAKKTKMLQLIAAGKSQREACDELEIGHPQLRT
jgi:hypothetical protein